jgi:hypothetical protein
MKLRAVVNGCLCVFVGCVGVAGVAAADSDGRWATPLGPGRTAVDGAKQIFPGGAMSGDQFVLAHDKILRIPGTTTERAELPADTHLQAPTAGVVRAQGRRYTLLIWDGIRPAASEAGGAGEGVSVLAVFPEGSAEPTDVAEVKLDRETYLSTEGTPRLGLDDSFTVLNAHLNAGEEFLITAIFHLREGRLRRIAEVYTHSTSGGCAQSATESLSWKTQAAGTRELPDLVAIVDVVRAPKADTKDCDPPIPRERHERYEDVYRWDPGTKQYQRASGTLNKRPGL